VPVVDDPVYGLKPSQSLRGGSPTTLATNSVPFLSGGGSVTMVDGRLRTVSFDRIYRTQPWVGRACRFTAEQFARLPLHLYGFTDDKGDARERDRKHPAAQLLAQPRPRRTGFHLRWDIGLSLSIHGEYVGWLRRRRPGHPPYEIWTLDWRSLIPLGEGDRVYGWRWTGTGVPGLRRGDVILVEDTLHLSYAAPGGGDFGVSPLQQLGVTIRSEDALQRLSEAAARNGTRYGAAIILDAKVKSDRLMREGIREELADAHGGIDQAFRSPVLGGGIVDIKPLGEQSAVEAELINQRKVNRDEIAAVSGIPGAVLGIYDEVKYSSLKELHRMLYVTSLGGPLGLVQESIQAQLINGEAVWARDERFLEWNLDEVLKGDTAERWTTYKIGVDFGGLTLNDVRRKENLPPYDDPRANEPLIAANNVRPLSAIGPGGDTGNPDDPNVARRGQALERIGELVASHRDRALERAAGVDDVAQALQALDGRRVARELEHDLEVAGVNGWSAALAETVAGELEGLIADAATVDDVRALITTGGDR
jgi:HK97 family phage portal protein